MNSYEKLIKLIRSESKKGQDLNMCLGEMTGSKTCKLKGMDLDADDFLIASGLECEAGDIVLITRITDDKYIIITKVVQL